MPASATMKPRYRSPSETEHPLADGDGDRKAGDSGHGSGTVPAFHSAEHAGARHGEHEHAGRPDWGVAGDRAGRPRALASTKFFHDLAAGEVQRA